MRVVSIIIPIGDHIGIRDPLKEEDILEEDPLMMDPLMELEDPLWWRAPLWKWRTPGPPSGQGPSGSQGPPGPVRPINFQTLDASTLENTFDSMGQSMLQLARVQDQTNRQLQQ